MIAGLILLNFLISLVASHGQIYVPPSRNVGDYQGQGCFVSWDQHYLRGFKCNNVCGNGWAKETGEVDPYYENTGPVRATYNMGQVISINFDQTGHSGYIRFRLCKLSSQNERVDQACLDQNLLEILSCTGNNKLKDKYTLAKLYTYENAVAQVKLPDGLACDNCVLQWEWITTTDNCVYENGAKAPEEYCMSQLYKNCMDVRIVNDPARPNQVYRANTVESVYGRTPAHAPVFWFVDWPNRMQKDNQGNFLRPNQPDPLRFKGTGLLCFADGQYAYGQNYQNYGRMCREGCMSPNKVCPNDCLCRWFEFDPLHGSIAAPLPVDPVNPVDPATQAPVTQAPVTQPPNGPVLPLYAQCGGNNYNGNKNCGPNAYCAFDNEWYSLCRPK